MVAKYLPVIFIFVFFIHAGNAQTFQTEEDIKHPAKLPAGVLKLLKKTKAVEECVNSGKLEAGHQLDASWFQAAKVNLNDDKFADYVVKNNEACLNGPRAASWWIFKGSRKGFTEVFEDSVLLLSIKKTRTAGFYDIQTETTMMNIIRNTWTFDGRKYKLKRTKIIDVSK
jgi:hypothetical protein